MDDKQGPKSNITQEINKMVCVYHNDEMMDAHKALSAAFELIKKRASANDERS